MSNPLETTTITADNIEAGMNWIIPERPGTFIKILNVKAEKSMDWLVHVTTELGVISLNKDDLVTVEAPVMDEKPMRVTFTIKESATAELSVVMDAVKFKKKTGIPFHSATAEQLWSYSESEVPGLGGSLNWKSTRRSIEVSRKDG